MFRNRYISFNPHHSFIRQRCGKISLQLPNERENIYGNSDYHMEYELSENNSELDAPDLNEHELDEHDEFDEEGEDEPDVEISGHETELNENEEYDELDEDKEYDELGENEEVLVDEPLKSEQMPHVGGEFAPYFSNVTET